MAGNKMKKAARAAFNSVRTVGLSSSSAFFRIWLRPYSIQVADNFSVDIDKANLGRFMTFPVKS
jgi:hypothetical protein